MSGYHNLPIAAKQALARDRMREPAVTCPTCGAGVMPVDLIEHQTKRCPGPRAPAAGSKWVRFREAIEIVPRQTLSRWVRAGLVRVRGELQDREYLLRDLVVKHASRRRSPISGTGRP